MLSVADCGIVSAGTYPQVNFKEKIMAMKKVVKQAQGKSKRSGDSSDVYQKQMQDVRSLAAAKASKASNSPSASTRSRSALQRPNSLAQPGRNMFSSAQGGLYPSKSKKVTKGLKK